VSFGGGVRARDCRFGAEEGGVPVIRNWCHGLGGFSELGRVHLLLDSCGQIAGGNGGVNTGVILLRKGLPNSITIRNCTGPVGASLISSSGIQDIAGSPSTVAYWLNAARNGTGRISVTIEGRNFALGAGQLIPPDLIPFAVYDRSEDGSRTIGMPLITMNMALALKRAPLPYSASIAVNNDNANCFDIVPTNATAFTIQSPTTARDGQMIEFRIINTIGGALGALTFGAGYRAASWAQPANGFSRVIAFRYTAQTAAWIEIYRTTDVPN
jgi:hypothetical protein